MKLQRLATAFALAAGMACGMAASADANTAPASTPSAHIKARPGLVLQPAHNSLCKRMPEECTPFDKKGQVVKMTPGIMRMLERTNDRINARVWYVSDKRQYGRADYWNYPSENRGDCEDYAIAKRRELIEKGWPPSSLLLATAFAETGEGHAVLVARTTDGDFILDNRFTNVKIWHELPYKWLTLQSSSHPERFDRIERSRAQQPATGAPK